MLQLQLQAFLQVAGADADRVELLNPVQDRQDFLDINFQAFIHAIGDFPDAAGQVAGIIDGVNNCIADYLIGL